MSTLSAASTIDLEVWSDHLALDGVSWDLYEMLWRQTRRPLRITYDRGRLELMSPLPKHERIKKILSPFVTTIAMERQIPIAHFGSTTFGRQSLEKGVEPDECFYVQNERAVRGREEFDWEVDPPPDLAIEVDVTNWSLDRLPIYGALGVPEIWRHDGTRLLCLHRLANGTYELAEFSRAFPFLPIADLNRFLARRHSESDTALLTSFAQWARSI